MKLDNDILFVLLVAGNLLGCRIWWWLLGAPLLRLWKQFRHWRRAHRALAARGVQVP
jgi:hypothetical protein